MSNAATAAVMCPVAVSTADNLAASADPFLMAVAVASSCVFLTPISHQNNTLILEPGGFRFGDYWQPGTCFTRWPWSGFQWAAGDLASPGP